MVLRDWAIGHKEPQPSFSGAPSTSTARSPPWPATAVTSTRTSCGSSHRWDGNTSTSPATTPGRAPTRSNPANTGHYDARQNL